jgi:hypothetical protein
MPVIFLLVQTIKKQNSAQLGTGKKPFFLKQGPI